MSEHDAGTGVRVLRLDHVQVAIPEDEAASARARWFYGGVLGLAELPKPQSLAGRGGMWYRCGDRQLHVGLDPDFHPATKAHLALVVSDLDGIVARLERAGLPVVRDVELPGVRRRYTADPAGNRLELLQRVRAEEDGAAAKDRVRAQFAHTAAAYVTSQGHAAGSDLARLVELVAPRATDVALDVSTGGGHTALALAPHVARVTASDLTPTMLAAARAFLTAQGVTNADYVVADAERLPFLTATFDLVTVRIAPHHYSDVRAAAAEMARVLRPGGRFVLVDTVAPEDPALDAFMNAIEWRRDPTHVSNYTETEWRAMVAEAGLVVTHAEHIPKPIQFADWVERSRMEDADREALERDMLAASPAARDHFAITIADGRVVSWRSDALILRAERAAG
ncbi:MAG TPA: methyltransferase domain-containing protein [Ktedonobacterales bacterium]|nr:methyltransferase domain-containing protein [Ktedonobacterales bacterium]